MVSLVESLLSNTVGLALTGSEILQALHVSGILILDSSTIRLTEEARGKFPGTRSKAGIKWHACFDLLSGQLKWFQLTASKVHDRNGFPELGLLEGKLILFDLGYFDYQLLSALMAAGAFFLCRLKRNSVVIIQEVISGLNPRCRGQSLLFACPSNQYRGNLLEAIIQKPVAGDLLICRAVGFWNPDEKRYHWYLTNLSIAAVILYPLYRLRWQIELIFKACKNSLNANAIPSANPNIIESLLLASIAAQLSSQSIYEIASQALSQEEELAISFQRTAYIFSILKDKFIRCILVPIQENIEIVVRHIYLMIKELYDPNYRKRKTSKARIYAELMNLNVIPAEH